MILGALIWRSSVAFVDPFARGGGRLPPAGCRAGLAWGVGDQTKHTHQRKGQGGVQEGCDWSDPPPQGWWRERGDGGQDGGGDRVIGQGNGKVNGNGNCERQTATANGKKGGGEQRERARCV